LKADLSGELRDEIALTHWLGGKYSELTDKVISERVC
jgi:hypothetical protein